MAINNTPSERGQKRLFNDLRLAAKRANQAMVRLERLGIDSPAYQYAQAALETMGVHKDGKTGRRFNERGVTFYNDYEYQLRIINKFLNAKTRTQKGAKQWVEDVWEGGNKAYRLEEHGISKEEWLDFWQSMPSSQKDRSFGSEVIVNMVRAYSMKIESDKEGKNERIRRKIDNQRLTVEQIAEKIQAAGNIKEAYKSLGLSYKDYQKSVKLGKL